MLGARVYKDPDVQDCPCCESEAHTVHNLMPDLWYIRCTSCPIQTEAKADRLELVEYWNTRPDNDDVANEQQRGDEQYDRAEKLEETLEKAMDVIEYCKEKLEEFFTEEEDDEPGQPIFRSK